MALYSRDDDNKKAARKAIRQGRQDARKAGRQARDETLAAGGTRKQARAEKRLARGSARESSPEDEKQKADLTNKITITYKNHKKKKK